MPPIVSIVGHKNSGKTTLIETLIALLRARGVRVATIKHDAHDFEIDHPGTDSYRHKRAGAAATAIVSADKMALVRDSCGSLDIEDVTDMLGPVDLILAEGYKSLDYPKIEVRRPVPGREALGDRLTHRIALYTSDPVEASVPVFRWTEEARLADFLLDRFLDKPRR